MTASPIGFAGINHVGLRVSDLARAQRFYRDVLGFAPHPDKSNWVGVGQGCPIHLMETDASGPVTASDPTRHVALRVRRLEDVVAHLLRHGCAPYQLSVTQQGRHAITRADDPLDFGIGTVFVDDPDGNVIEFMQMDRGIFAQHDPS